MTGAVSSTTIKTIKYDKFKPIHADIQYSSFLTESLQSGNLEKNSSHPDQVYSSSQVLDGLK